MTKYSHPNVAELVKINSYRGNCVPKVNDGEKVYSNLEPKRNKLRDQNKTEEHTRQVPLPKMYWIKGLQIVIVIYSQIKSLYNSKTINREKWESRNAVIFFFR